jgi:hypothetical protein
MHNAFIALPFPSIPDPLSLSESIGRRGPPHSSGLFSIIAPDGVVLFMSLRSEAA